MANQNLKKWAPQAQASRPGPYTAEAAGVQKVDGETIPRRNHAAKDGLNNTPQEGIDTVVVNGEITWTAADGYAPDARAGQITTR